MFGNGMTEWLLVAVVALLVLGPERLPTLVRSAGRAAGKVRGMWSEVQKTKGAATGCNKTKLGDQP